MAVLSIGYIIVAFLGPSEQTSYFEYVAPADNRLQINLVLNKHAL